MKAHPNHLVSQMQLILIVIYCLDINLKRKAEPYHLQPA